METNPEFKEIESTPPQWAGDYLSRGTVMPVPVKLDVAQFNAVDAVKVIVGAAGAAKGATSIPVDALLGKIPINTILNFGEYAPVVVTVGAAGAAANATSVPVDALSAMIPAGTLLDFGGKKFARLSANAAANATSLAVDALATALVDDDTATFKGGTKFARLTAAAAANATSLAVDELPLPLVDDNTATYQGVGKKSVPSGTFIGRTFTERDAGAAWGPADYENDDQLFLTTRDLADLSVDNTNEIYRHNKVVKENYLPGWANKSAGEKAKIRVLYSCIGGKD